MLVAKESANIYSLGMACGTASLWNGRSFLNIASEFLFLLLGLGDDYNYRK